MSHLTCLTVWEGLCSRSWFRQSLCDRVNRCNSCGSLLFRFRFCRELNYWSDCKKRSPSFRWPLQRCLENCTGTPPRHFWSSFWLDRHATFYGPWCSALCRSECRRSLAVTAGFCWGRDWRSSRILARAVLLYCASSSSSSDILCCDYTSGKAMRSASSCKGIFHL